MSNLALPLYFVSLICLYRSALVGVLASQELLSKEVATINANFENERSTRQKRLNGCPIPNGN